MSTHQNARLAPYETRDLSWFEGAVPFDLAPCPQFSYPEDFDQEKFDTWLRLSGITYRSRIEEVLVNIEAAEWRADGELLFRNAGVLFFAKNVCRFFRHAYITCLLARGTEKVDILCRKDFNNGIVTDIEDAMRFVERNTRTAYRIERLQRENVPEYPPRAVREAITNAVMHRDWFIDGANVVVEVHTNHAKVVSPGSLPQGVSLPDLGSLSVRRNALVADLLHRIDFIEKAGSGIRRIRNEAREQRCLEPEFKANGSFTATFWPNPYVRPRTDARSLESGTGQVTGQVTGEDTGEVTGQVAGEVTGQVTGEVTGEIRLLRAMAGEMTRKQIQKSLGLRHEDHFRKAYLLPSLQAGLIEMTIPDKPRSRNQRYRLTPKGHEFLRHTKES